MYTEPSKMWWEEITGPQSLVRTLADQIQAAKSVLLFVPDDLPWRQQMRLSVERVLRSTDTELLIWCIDCQTDCQQFLLPDGGIDVSGFLLHERADSDVRNGYRKSSGISVQQYMISNHVLKDRVVWVKGLDARQTKSWINFCRGYCAATQYEGVFVIESYEDLRGPVPANMVKIDYLDYVSRYDALLFNNMIAAGVKAKEVWKSYLASLATMICNLDVELADSFLGSYDYAVSDIIETVTEIAESDRFCRRFHAPHLDPAHPFSLIRSGRQPEIDKRIWKAQLQVLYPLIEIERVSFIEKYREEIQQGLLLEYTDKNDKRRRIDQYGIELTDPYEAEIGTLYRMHRLRIAGEYDKYILPVMIESDRERLTLIHEMRNLLAHVSICSVEMVNRFLSQFPYAW